MGLANPRVTPPYQLEVAEYAHALQLTKARLVAFNQIHTEEQLLARTTYEGTVYRMYNRLVERLEEYGIVSANEAYEPIREHYKRTWVYWETLLGPAYAACPPMHVISIELINVIDLCAWDLRRHIREGLPLAESVSMQRSYALFVKLEAYGVPSGADDKDYIKARQVFDPAYNGSYN